MDIFDLVFIALMWLQVLDLITTVYGIEQGKVEANPLLKKLFAIFPPILVLVVMKAGFLYASYWLYSTNKTTECFVVLAIASLFYLLVVVNNIKVLRSE